MLDSFGNHLGKTVCVLAQFLEANSEVLDDIKIIAVAVETSGFTIEQDSSDVGIVSKCLSECGFPFVSATVSFQPDAVVGRFANGPTGSHNIFALFAFGRFVNRPYGLP